MSVYQKQFLIMGALFLALAVCLGAFAAHGLKTVLSPAMLDTVQTGARYQFYHGLGLLMLGVLGHYLHHSRAWCWSGRFMMVGVLLFCGSLYGYVASQIKGLVVLTPIGGLCFIVAWLLLILSVYRAPVR